MGRRNRRPAHRSSPHDRSVPFYYLHPRWRTVRGSGGTRSSRWPSRIDRFFVGLCKIRIENVMESSPGDRNNCLPCIGGPTDELRNPSLRFVAPAHRRMVSRNEILAAIHHARTHLRDSKVGIARQIAGNRCSYCHFDRLGIGPRAKGRRRSLNLPSDHFRARSLQPAPTWPRFDRRHPSRADAISAHHDRDHDHVGGGPLTTLSSITT